VTGVTSIKSVETIAKIPREHVASRGIRPLLLPLPGEGPRECSSRAIVFLLRMIEKRRSKIHGWGVFATRAIPKNTRIIHYAGERISNQKSLMRERRYYIHIVGGVIWIRASRKIAKGEEITYNYNTDGVCLIECRCRNRCQGLL
jgi:hypothetical protein